MAINVLSKGRGLLGEFRAFALKGNVIDLAVGVIIGAAFAKIVDSMVKNLIMPLISYVTPNTDYSEWVIDEKIRIGLLLNDVLSFLIVAVALFLFVVKFLGWVMRLRAQEAAEPAPAAPPAPTRQEVLLEEIRDLLKASRATGDGHQDLVRT
jgi:large conductance mechanosensitive channel